MVVSSFRIFESRALLTKLRLRASSASYDAIMPNVIAKLNVETSVLSGFKDGQAASRSTGLQDPSRQYKGVRTFKGTV